MPSAALLAKARQPLGNASHLANGCRVSEQTFCGKVIVRGATPDFHACVEKVIGPLPQSPCTSASSQDATRFWLGPNEWLIHVKEDRLEPTLALLRDAVSGLHAAVVDVSDYYTVIRVESAHARLVLAEACPLDLHPTQFRTGSCARSLFGNAEVLLHQVDDLPTYDLQVRRSFADYLFRYLCAAAECSGPS